MAEAFAASLAPLGGIKVIAASMTPAPVNPATVAVMAEAGLSIGKRPQLTLLDVEPFSFDLTITLGDFDLSCRPNLPGMPPHFHWDLPDPKPDAPFDSVRKALREARDELQKKVETLFSSDILSALFVTRKNFELILDNLLDGVLAHTRNRRIFFFNKAAEKITGYSREKILGQDCHEVFPGRFCGGECEFCDPSRSRGGGPKKKEIEFLRPDGGKRVLAMSIMSLLGDTGGNVGALISFKDETELSLLKTRVRHHHFLCGMVGKDPLTLNLFDQVREVAQVPVPVLIQGESGTGKELVAAAVHELSGRGKKPFVAVNCGALPEGILESELFGHVRGAFTGAVSDKKGRFELADGGTIFLDEIGEISPAMQVKLLRVLQEQTFERVGGEKTIKVDVRVVSATNQDLKILMEKRLFRRDLYYRLCVVPVFVPPLRERRLDIPVLVEHFLEMVARELRRPPLTPGNEALDLLTSYPWPGNVRELANAVEYAYVKCRSGVMETRHLPPEIIGHQQKGDAKQGLSRLLSREDILLASAKAYGNRKKTAEILGVGRATLYRYLSLYGIK